MSALELAPGVWRIPTSKGDRDNAFLVEGDDGYTLVDVGWKGASAVLLGVLSEQRRSLTDLKRIVITHAHPDHVRGLAEFRKHAPVAQVLIHADDAGWLRHGRVPRGGRHSPAGRVLDAVPLLQWTPVDPDGELDDGTVVDGSGGLQVIHTPGHSPGHVVLLHQPSGTLLTGDVLLNRGNAPGNGPNALAWDPALRDASAAKLPRDVNAIGVAHGASLVDTASLDAYHQWLDDLARR